MNVAALATTSTRSAARERQGRTHDGGQTTEVPVQLARKDREGSVPALASIPSPERLQLRCSRIALAMLVPEGGRFFTPQNLPELHARLYVPQRRCSEPVLVRCVLDEVAVSDCGEFILHAHAADVSPEDRLSLTQFCARRRPDPERAPRSRLAAVERPPLP